MRYEKKNWIINVDKTVTVTLVELVILLILYLFFCALEKWLGTRRSRLSNGAENSLSRKFLNDPQP